MSAVLQKIGNFLFQNKFTTKVISILGRGNFFTYLNMKCVSRDEFLGTEIEDKAIIAKK